MSEIGNKDHISHKKKYADAVSYFHCIVINKSSYLWLNVLKVEIKLYSNMIWLLTWKSVNQFFNLGIVPISFSKIIKYVKLLSPQILKAYAEKIRHFLGVILSELIPSLQIEHFVRLTLTHQHQFRPHNQVKHAALVASTIFSCTLYHL